MRHRQLYPISPPNRSPTKTPIGGNITFSVDANGTGLTYQWQKQDANGTWVNIGGATASSYAINSVQAIHAGTYRVAITNASGGTTYSSNSVLNVSGSPTPTPELVFDGTNWNQAQQVRVRFADGKLPTYLELDALVIDPNQALYSDPQNPQYGPLNNGLTHYSNPYNSSSPDLKPDFVGTQFAFNQKHPKSSDIYDYNFKGVEPSIQGEGIDLVWELKMDAPLTGEVKLRPQFRSDSMQLVLAAAPVILKCGGSIIAKC